MAAEGMHPDPEDMIVTTGGQQAIDLIARRCSIPATSVICEAPTYPGAVPVFCSYQAETIQVEMDDEGCGSTSSRSCSTGSRPRAGGRSSSTPSRPSRTRPG